MSLSGRVGCFQLWLQLPPLCPIHVAAASSWLPDSLLLLMPLKRPPRSLLTRQDCARAGVDADSDAGGRRRRRRDGAAQGPSAKASTRTLLEINGEKALAEQFCFTLLWRRCLRCLGVQWSQVYLSGGVSELRCLMQDNLRRVPHGNQIVTKL